jgi:hypothetical protein
MGGFSGSLGGAYGSGTGDDGIGSCKGGISGFWPGGYIIVIIVFPDELSLSFIYKANGLFDK